MPFVQGHLRREPMEVTIRTVCDHCDRSIEIVIDNDLQYRMVKGTDPLIFLPMVDFEKLKDPSIIHAF